MSNQKNTLSKILLILSLILVFLPLFNTLSDIFTRIVIKSNTFTLIRDYIAPIEMRSVATFLIPFGFESSITNNYLSIGKGDNKILLEIAWNCLGWQSIIFLLITFFIGLQGNGYTNMSKFKAILLGIGGTYLINIFRISAVGVLAFYFNQKTALVFHDLGSTIITIIWLFSFWVFSYKYILISK